MAAVTAAALSVLVDCSHVGDSCDAPGTWVCLDPGSNNVTNHTSPSTSKAAAVCRGGTWVTVPCNGGCRTTRANAAGSGSKYKYHYYCDFGRVAEADACLSDGIYACSSDGKSDLVCKSGKFVTDRTCKGRNGCQAPPSDGRSTVQRDTCDDSMADVGDSCWTERGASWSCSSDGKSKLQCVGGKWAVFSVCGGPKGCDVASGFECDVSLGKVGDACHEQRGDANFACTQDRTGLVECKGGRFVEVGSCPGPKRCWLDDAQLPHCDGPHAR